MSAFRDDQTYDREGGTTAFGPRRLVGKRRVSIGVIPFQVDILIGEFIQSNRSEKWLRRFDEQDGLRKAVIVEAAAEVNARFDRENLKGIDVQPQAFEGEGFDDLHEIGAQNQDVVPTELDADPNLTVVFDGIQDRAPYAHRFASGFVCQTAYRNVDHVSSFCALRPDLGSGTCIRDGGDQDIG